MREQFLSFIAACELLGIRLHQAQAQPQAASAPEITIGLHDTPRWLVIGANGRRSVNPGLAAQDFVERQMDDLIFTTSSFWVRTWLVAAGERN